MPPEIQFRSAVDSFTSKAPKADRVCRSALFAARGANRRQDKNEFDCLELKLGLQPDFRQIRPDHRKI